MRVKSFMPSRPKLPSVSGAVIIAPLQLALTSCSSGGAPSFTLFGAFFPAWLLCGIIGVVGAAVARIACVSTGLSNTLPYQLFVCAAAGVIVAVLTWFVWFGR